MNPTTSAALGGLALLSVSLSPLTSCTSLPDYARPSAVGRKNHYGSRSERVTPVAALFYSLIASAKLCGVEPRAYLRDATFRAARNPASVTLARDLKSSNS